MKQEPDIDIDNPPAFPSTVTTETYTDHYSGMQLRDYFAAKAMQGVISKYGCDVPFAKDASPWPMAAQFAYEIADAMIARRAKP